MFIRHRDLDPEGMRLLLLTTPEPERRRRIVADLHRTIDSRIHMAAGFLAFMFWAGFLVFACSGDIRWRPLAAAVGTSIGYLVARHGRRRGRMRATLAGLGICAATLSLLTLLGQG